MSVQILKFLDINGSVHVLNLLVVFTPAWCKNIKECFALARCIIA